MKTINIGIMAHVDAGKTTLTESMLYTSGAVEKAGRVDRGTAVTDSMMLEKQRGITIQTSVVSFYWGDTKVNLLDTPGHMDFFAEVERSLSILDGAVLLISAKDGIQAQTRILFEAIKKLQIPALVFINKIDQPGIELEPLYTEIKEKLAPNILVMQDVSIGRTVQLNSMDMFGSSFIDTIIEADEALTEKYVLDQPVKLDDIISSREQSMKNGTLLPIYHGSALGNIGTKELMDALIKEFSPLPALTSVAPCALVYKIEQDDLLNKHTYLRVFGGLLQTRDVVTVADRDETIKIKKLEIPQSGGIAVVEQVECGDIAIIPNENGFKIGDTIGEVPEKYLPAQTVHPMMQASISPCDPDERGSLLEALSELAQSDPLLQYRLDSRSSDIVVGFLGQVQMEVVCALLENRYHIPVQIGDLTTIYKERPLKKAEYTVHIEVPPNPFWASIGLSIEPLPIGSGLCLESKVSYGYLNRSFQNAVADGIKYGCEQGLFGWEVTDLKVCFEYGLYYSPVSTPADFRHLAPLVFEQVLKRAGTELLEPRLDFQLFVPQDSDARAYNDLNKYQAVIDSIETRHSEIVVSGSIPARTAPRYKKQLSQFTNGRGMFLTEPSGYQPNVGKPVYQARKPDARLDKTRYLFEKAFAAGVTHEPASSHPSR